jgi:hypothetical protein
MGSLSIQSAVVVILPVAVIFQNIHHTSHLTENQNSRILFLQLWKQLVQNNHFATVVNDVLVGGVRRT